MHFVYILKRKNNELYVGYTNDLQRRLNEHKNDYPCKLMYFEAYGSEKLARDRERKLKYYGSAWRGLKKRLSA